MSNSFTAIAFSVVVMSAEGALAKDCLALCDELDILSYDKDVAGIAKAYEETSPHFKSTFPMVEGEADPFVSFRRLFDDPQCPSFGVDIDIEPASEAGTVAIVITSRDADLSALANLLQKVCRSALPVAFTYASYSDRLRVGSIDGGFVGIDADNIDIQSGAAAIERPWRKRPAIDQFVDRHVFADVTSFITKLASEGDQQAQALLEAFNYEETAIADGWVFVDGKWRGYNWDEFESWQAADAADRCDSFATAKQVCNHTERQPDNVAFTHVHLISPWLASRLQDEGERVDTDIFGMCVWARQGGHDLDLHDLPILAKIAS